MNHKVNNVQQLHSDASSLMNNVVLGSGDASADTILANLNAGIENLKANWKGKDAGVQILSLIRVHNAMVSVRNALAQLAADSSKVAANYREIQNANGAGLEILGVLTFEAKSNLADYSDTADTVDINSQANTGKQNIDAANNNIDAFIGNVKSSYSAIKENWTVGTGRDSAEEAFSSFISNVAQYKQVLAETSSNIATALQNYTM
ncbi:MAG: hypothetical protein IJE89_01490 [Bacilli bacterium]|nr:hypothetical protein [Bacilli bacterium]